jgi:hypothetical protein
MGIGCCGGAGRGDRAAIVSYSTERAGARDAGAIPRIEWCARSGRSVPRRTGTTRSLDTTSWKRHNRRVGPTRLNIPDARGRGGTLRVTRQPGQRKVVFSHWRDGRCVATTPIELSEVPGLIGVLVDALGVAADMAHRPSIVPPPRSRVMSAMRRWVHPRLAQVTELRSLREHKTVERTG